MEFERIDAGNRRLVNEFLTAHWLSTDMVIRGEIVDMTAADGYFVSQNGDIAALITYTVRDGTCEITSLDSLIEGRGIGSALVGKVVDTAKACKCRRVIVITTNDNIDAIRFYQKRGFDMARLYHNALNQSRELKPSIPLVGDNGIPLLHEIEFEMLL